MSVTSRHFFGLGCVLAFLLCTSFAVAGAWSPQTVLIEDAEAGVKVTLADYQAALGRLPGGQEAGSLREPVIHQVLDSLFIHRMLAREMPEEARLAVLADLPEPLEASADPVEEAGQRQWVERHLSVARLALIDDGADMDAVRQWAHERYLANREQFRLQDEVSARHILVGMTDRSEEEALEKALELQGLLMADPDRFAELAEAHSDDPGSAARGGDLGRFGRGRMVPAFEEAAFTQPVGVVGDPVLTPFGYHLVLVEERQEGRPLSYEEVEADLVESALREHIQIRRGEYIQQIRLRPSVNVHWDVVDELIRHGGLPPTAP